MDTPNTSPAGTPPAAHGWWLVLALVGLDYFSTLAYLPSLAVEVAGGDRRLVPFIALGVVLVGFLCALPVYWYLAARANDGEGATGLLDRLIKGWFGKLLLLVLLGFAATDYLITRALSTADAAVHIRKNPFWAEHADGLGRGLADAARAGLPAWLGEPVAAACTPQLLITLLLTGIAFAAYAYLILGFTRAFLRLAFTVVTLYLALTALVVVAGLLYLAGHPEIGPRWLEAVHPDGSGSAWSLVGGMLLLAVLTFPQMALGLSGFELSLTALPLVKGDATDTPEAPTGRIRNSRKMLVVAAVVMSAFVLTALPVVALLVPAEQFAGDGPARFRALAYLAHGGRVEGDAFATGLFAPLFNPYFGTLYDLVSVIILGLAGAGAAIGSRQLVPRLLARYGMQLEWAGRWGVISHLLNLVMLAVLIAYRADVGAMVLVYAASVLALLSGAAMAALIDAWRRNAGSWTRYPRALPWLLVYGFFLAMVLLTLWDNPAGLGLALAVVLTVLATAILSRYLRSKELRFQGFTFADAASEARWEAIRNLDFQVLVPHRPEHETLATKEAAVRARHRLGPEVPILFIEVELGDPSEFYQRPLMAIRTEDGREVLRISGCASIPHVLAALCLEFRHVGAPPEIHFDWSDEPALAANLHFLLYGRGNIPWMVHELIRHAEPDPARRPRVVIG